MNGTLLNIFSKKHPDYTITKSFDVGSELLIRAVPKGKENCRAMDPYYFINKSTGSIRGARIPKDLPTIREAFTSSNELTIKNGD